MAHELHIIAHPDTEVGVARPHDGRVMMNECRIPPEGGVGASDGGPPAGGYPPEPRSSQDLIDAVNAAFFLDPDFATRQFDVTAKDGVVTLHGYVRSEEERQRAIDIVQDIQGVDRVVDELVVHSEI